MSERSQDLTLQELRSPGSDGPGNRRGVIEFSRDVMQKLFVLLAEKKKGFAAWVRILFEAARCAKDGQLRAVITVHSYSGTEDLR